MRFRSPLGGVRHTVITADPEEVLQIKDFFDRCGEWKVEQIRAIDEHGSAIAVVYRKGEVDEHG